MEFDDTTKRMRQPVIFAIAQGEMSGVLRYGREPVWPCPTSEHLQALRARAALFGGGVTLVDSRNVQQGQLTPVRDEVVVALGRDAGFLGELYAHLTSRRNKIIDDLIEIDDLPNIAVIITTWDRLRVDDFERLYEYSQANTPLGIIAGIDGEDLYRRVLLQAAASRLCALDTELPIYTARTLLPIASLPDDAFGFETEMAGLEADARTVCRMLRGPSSVLGFSGHCDGVDAKLAKGAVLCPRVGQPDNDAWGRAANCDSTGYCHRKRQPRTEALQSEGLISPDVITTRILLMCSCYVALGADCSVEPRAGLMQRLMENPGIGTIVASWEATTTYFWEVLLFLDPLLQGETIGSAWKAFELSAPSAIRGCGRYLIFGDPLIRAMPSRTDNTESALTFPVLDELSQRTSEQPPSNLTDGAQCAAWLEFRIEQLNKSLKLSDELISSARQALINLKGSEQSREAAYRELLRLVLAHEASLFRQWFEDTSQLPHFIDRPTRCFGCQAKGRLFEFKSALVSRWLACCTQCNSFYADVPASSALVDASFELTSPQSMKHTIPQMPNQILALNLRTARENRRTWFWDEPFDFSQLPPGRSWLWLYSLSDMGLHAYSRLLDNRPIRAAENDAARLS